LRATTIRLLVCVLMLATPTFLRAQSDKCGTPLIAAIRARDASAAKKLIESGVDLNTKDCGTTPLIESIALNQLEIAEKLILAGASTKVGDGLNTLPLMIASWYCDQGLVSLLLDRGADVNAVDSKGNSALIHSAQNCEDGAVPALLLRYGAKINLAAQDGDTALRVAAFYGNEHVVYMLVAAGADPTAKTKGGETPLTIARDREVGRKPSHDRIYQFLLEVTRLDQKLKIH
jgi:uncharacterized protein